MPSYLSNNVHNPVNLKSMTAIPGGPKYGNNPETPSEDRNVSTRHDGQTIRLDSSIRSRHGRQKAWKHVRTFGRTSGPLQAPHRESVSQQFNSDSDELDRLLGGVLFDGDGEPIVSTTE